VCFKKLKYIVVFISFYITNYSLAQLIINEACSKNNTTIQDFEGDFEDWIEIKNTSNSSIILGKFYLSNDSQNPFEWQLPEYTLNANELILIFASSKNLYLENEWHSNFKLSAEGETLYLSNTEGTKINTVNFPALKADNSYGFNSINSTYVYYETPTPKNKNETSIPYNGYALFPGINLPAGIFFEAVNFNYQNTDKSLTIRYTTDGNYPTNESEILPEQNLFNKDTVLSLRAFKPGLIPSNVEVRSLLFNKATAYPIISLVFPPAFVFDEINGMYVIGPYGNPYHPFENANFWNDIKHPAFVNYFDENMQMQLADFYELKLHGLTSRMRPMKAIRITAKKKYGPSKIEYNFFEERAKIEEYNTIIFRNSGQDFNKTMFRDAFLQLHFKKYKIDCEYQWDKLALVYFNGEFWGIHHIRDFYDETYFSQYASVAEDEVNLGEYYFTGDLKILGDLQSWEDLQKFIDNNSLSNTENYKLVQQQIDLNSITDFFIAESFINNIDWPQNNVKFWKTNKSSSKWRYAFFDLDASFGWFDQTIAEANRLGDVLNDSKFDDNSHVKLFKALLNNKNFKNEFVNRYCDLLNSAFLEDSLTESILLYKEKLLPEIEAHHKKWDINFEDWNKEIDSLLIFAKERNSYAIRYLKSALELEKQIVLTIKENSLKSGFNFKINSIEVDKNYWKGNYFKEVPQKIEVLTKDENRVFKYWLIEEEDKSIEKIENEIFEKVFDNNAIITAIYENENSGITLESEKIIFYPNPFKGNLLIEKLDNKNTAIVIYDVKSTKILEYTSNKIITDLDLKHLPAGVYYFKVISENFSQIKKVIKL